MTDSTDEQALRAELADLEAALSRAECAKADRIDDTFRLQQARERFIASARERSRVPN